MGDGREAFRRFSSGQRQSSAEKTTDKRSLQLFCRRAFQSYLDGLARTVLTQRDLYTAVVVVWALSLRLRKRPAGERCRSPSARGQ